MELEGVGAIAMRGVLGHVGGEIDDGDGIKGTFFDTDTTSNAQLLADPCNLGLGAHLDAQLA